MSKHMMQAVGLVAVAALCGCDPFIWGELEDDAAVRVLEAPDGYPNNTGFGRLLVGFSSTGGAEPESHLLASAGDNTPYLVYEAWQDGDVALSKHTVAYCDDSEDCSEGEGAAIAGIPLWRAGTPSEGRMCVLATAPDSGAVIVRCAAQPGDRFRGIDGVDFGRTAASLGEGNALGVAVLGAPGEDLGTGGLYLLPDASAPIALDLPDEALSASGRLGDVLTAYTSSGRTLVAASAPAVGRVVVMELVSGTMGPEANVLACLERSEIAEYGSVLAFGDVSGDGEPELFVSGGLAGENPSPLTVHMYAGADLPSPGGCGDWDSEPTSVACPDGLRDVPCEDSGFGRALAVGDVDGDGRGELLVGAPFAEVDGQRSAGAVFVMPMTASPTNAVLTHSSPEQGDLLGSTITTLRTGLGTGLVPRDEPVVGAPGANAAVAFLCTGLTGDTPSDTGVRCIPQ